MSKRNKFVVMSAEAETLKKLRLKSDLSLRKLSDKLNISFARVHQLESGRENISEEYIDKFLAALSLNRDDWNFAIGGRDEIYDLREKCHHILDSIQPSKLELIYELLSNFNFH